MEGEMVRACKMRNAYRILIRKVEGKRSLGRHRHVRVYPKVSRQG
jgi:hypothetical protein